MKVVAELAPDVGAQTACQALGVPRSSLYRHRARLIAGPRPLPRRRPTPARALAVQERQQILDLLHSPRFVDASPAEVYATLLDEGLYLCSQRTMYRLLHTQREIRERRNQLRHPKYRKPELLATGPNQVWSWDITKLRGPVKWLYYYLYVILDIFSRFVVGWMLADRESETFAKHLIAETIAKYDLPRGQLTLHADRGACMTSNPLAHLLAQLGVYKSHSRPHTSNDNPYSEAQLKTLKYHPLFPNRFGSSQDARAFCRSFFHWYNHQHHHSGLVLLTPADVHFGQAPEILQRRTQTLQTAYSAHPERFRRLPKPQELPKAVWINPPTLEDPKPVP